jgi:hypothetical protein
MESAPESSSSSVSLQRGESKTNLLIFHYIIKLDEGIGNSLPRGESTQQEKWNNHHAWGDHEEVRGRKEVNVNYVTGESTLQTRGNI